MIGTSAVGLVVLRHASHVSEEVAPHAIRASMLSIGAVDILVGGLGAIVVASAISTTVLPRLTVRVGSAAVCCWLYDSIEIGERTSA